MATTAPMHHPPTTCDPPPAHGCRSGSRPGGTDTRSNTSKRYTDEYKKDAVELVRSSGRTVADVARELGVSTEGLRGWVDQAKTDRGEGSTPRRSATVRRCPPRAWGHCGPSNSTDP
jgi:hypothetical protein